MSKLRKDFNPGTPLGVEIAILEQRRQEKIDRRNQMFSIIGTVTGIVGAITGIAAFIVSILK